MRNPLRHPLWALPLVLTTALAAQNGKDKVDFQTHVLPILEQNCFDCHRTAYTDANGRMRRPKGGVAMDTKESFLKGKRGRPIAVGGKPDISRMIEVVTLPLDDEDHMPPPDKKEPLSDAQVETLKNWIAQGAEFGNWVGKTADGSAAPAGAGDDDEEGPGRGRGGNRPGREDYFAALAKDLKPLADDVIQKAAGQKAKIEPARPGSPLLRVSFPGHEDEAADAEIAALGPIATHVAILDLGRTKVTDTAAAHIGKMKKLVRLDVRETGVGDKAVAAIAGLGELRQLNLYGTKVTDAGIAGVAKLPKLERLYVWQTGISAEAVEKLKQAKPRLMVSFAADMPEGRPEGGRRGRGGRGGNRPEGGARPAGGGEKEGGNKGGGD